jgi:hypothetical protein
MVRPDRGAMMNGQPVTKDFDVMDAGGKMRTARVRVEFTYYAEDENGQTIDGPLDSMFDAIDACIDTEEKIAWEAQEARCGLPPMDGPAD